MILVELLSKGIVYLQFTDLRDAINALSISLRTRPEWLVQHVSVKHMATKSLPQSIFHPTAFEGKLTITALFSGPRQRFNAEIIGHLVKEMLENYGDLVSYDVGQASYPRATFTAEFFNTVATDLAIASLDGFKLGVRSHILYSCIILT